MTWFKSKRKKEFPKMINVYISKEFNKIIIVPLFVDSSWVHYEQEETAVILNMDVTDSDLGASIKNNLNKFEEKEANFSKRNLRDWPAFKESKLKTTKEFEAKYSKISISGLNPSNLILAFDAETNTEHEIDLRTIISAHSDDAQLGERLRRLYDALIEFRINK